MAEIILHHYPESPFAEKCRVMFGLKRLAWRSVRVPVILPKPDLVALTGGHRRAPTLQIGADIYCDTALIARVIDAIEPEPALWPAGKELATASMAAWADTYWFGAGVAYALQPEGFRSMFDHLTPEQMAAFAADRKLFRAGGTVPRVSLEAATTLLRSKLGLFELQLHTGGAHFLVGQHASLADLSFYHPLWFVRRAPAVAGLLDRYPNVLAWMARIVALGHGRSEPMTGEQAIAVARAAQPIAPDTSGLAGGPVAGSAVSISAVDYGIEPSSGRLVGAGPDEWVIAREDARAGLVHVHFPRNGFLLTAADG